MAPTKEQILAVFYEEWESHKITIGDGLPCTMATWRIRARLERGRGNPKFTCAQIRKTILEMVRSGKLSKHWTSRRGNAVWAFKGE